MPHMNLCQLHHYHGVDPNRCFVCEEQKLRNENTMLRGQLEKDQALVMRLCIERERLIAALEEIESHGDQHRETCRAALAGKAPG